MWNAFYLTLRQLKEIGRAHDKVIISAAKWMLCEKKRKIK